MENTREYIEFSNLLIDRLGGTYKTAAQCGVKPPSVSEWRKTGISELRMKLMILEHRHLVRKLTEETGFDVKEYILRMNGGF